MYPDDLRYSKEHEWVRLDGDEATVGITDYAQEELGDIVYVELPEEGDGFKLSDSFAIVESVKAASDVYSPLSGEVLAVNAELDDKPELVNEDPYGAGWMIRLRPGDAGEMDELLDAAGYEALISELRA
ncbi:MAG: glycine cleavage system protein GcvH [Chloroflexi bacterium]|nr:glycine cleavage system protein GcvH [Chloroflexota bacterium]